MISPHTPPGTLVVFRPVTDKFIWSEAHMERWLIPNYVYRVDRMVKCSFGSHFAVCLIETASFHKWRKYDNGPGKYRYSFPLEDFYLAVLPKCLTDIRDAAMIPRQERVRG